MGHSSIAAGPSAGSCLWLHCEVPEPELRIMCAHQVVSLQIKGVVSLFRRALPSDQRKSLLKFTRCILEVSSNLLYIATLTLHC